MHHSCWSGLPGHREGTTMTTTLTAAEPLPTKCLRPGIWRHYAPPVESIDVAEGEKIPRKGGPGITRSDLLVINKIDLAPLVGANLDVMKADALRMRVRRPFIFTNLKSGEGVAQIASFVIDKGGLARSAA